MLYFTCSIYNNEYAAWEGNECVGPILRDGTVEICWHARRDDNRKGLSLRGVRGTGSLQEGRQPQGLGYGGDSTIALMPQNLFFEWFIQMLFQTMACHGVWLVDTCCRGSHGTARCFDEFCYNRMKVLLVCYILLLG